MKINFLWGTSNVISIYSWKNPECAIYDPNRDEEAHWVSYKLHKKLHPESKQLYKPISPARPRPKEPFVPRIVKAPS
tara:strand:- start:19 stop:249 length:231 start_codon:yes stop_codon:yes gene_type:complete